MSKLQMLIDELCPNGVEHKTIKEIATDIYRGTGIKRDEVTESGIPCVLFPLPVLRDLICTLA